MRNTYVTIKRWSVVMVAGHKSVRMYFPYLCTHEGCQTMHYTVPVTSEEGDKFESKCINCKSTMYFRKDDYTPTLLDYTDMDDDQ